MQSMRPRQPQFLARPAGGKMNNDRTLRTPCESAIAGGNRKTRASPSRAEPPPSVRATLLDGARQLADPPCICGFGPRHRKTRVGRRLVKGAALWLNFRQSLSDCMQYSAAKCRIRRPNQASEHGHSSKDWSFADPTRAGMTFAGGPFA